MAAAKKKTLAQRIKADPKLKAKYLANPGLRSKLPDSALTPELRKRRQVNTFNKAPITPGSTVTNQQLATEADAAVKSAYGSEQQGLESQYAKAQGLGRDVTGWYDAYRKELQQHTANTQAMNVAAVGQIGALGAGMRGLDQTALTDQQTAANADAATRGASAANLGPDASNASLVRQQMLAGYGVEQVGLGAAAGRFADTRANVVAPTQKLQAQAQAAQGVRDVGSKITELGQRKGAYATKYKGERVADEAKTVLANKALGVNAANVQADAAAAAARTGETVRHNKASETNTRNATNARANADANKVNPHGYTNADWAAMTPDQRRKIIAQDKGSKGAAIKPATRQAHAKTKTEIDDAQTWIKRLRQTKTKDGKPLTDAQIRDQLATGVTGQKDDGKGGKVKIKIPKLSNDAVNAAYDLINGGELSPGSVKALHRAGISIRQLGYPTTGARHKKAGKGPLKQLVSDINQTRKALRP